MCWILNSISLHEYVGFGKAVLPMAEQVKAILGDRISQCIVNIPVGFRDAMVEGIGTIHEFLFLDNKTTELILTKYFSYSQKLIEELKIISQMKMPLKAQRKL